MNEQELAGQLSGILKKDHNIFATYPPPSCINISNYTQDIIFTHIFDAFLFSDSCISIIS